jgi:hypothetical protein
MELDEFKLVLKSKTAEDVEQHSASELEKYIRRRTTSIIGKIKQSMWFEFTVTLFFVATFSYAWFRYHFLYVRAFSGLAIVLCFFFFIYLAKLYKKITSYEQTSFAVKESLQQIIYILRRFTRLYFQLTMIMLPVAFIFGLITGYLEIQGGIAIKNFNWLRGIIFYTSLFIFWSATTWFFTKWYIKKLYGNYLEQLKEQLKELENG